jgi:glycosyltransferase involved in cell wall biosynthesis
MDTMDFHFKEFIRKYEYTKDPKDLILANEFLKYEKILYLAADTVVVISENEKRDIQDKIPGINNIQVIPNIHQISISTRPYHKRRNICFVGNFGNKHNVDAVRYFLKNIYEFVAQKNPREHFHILGMSSEKYRKEFSRSNVKVIGQLKNLHKALTYYKLFVCPMTYGAGLKGKIGEAIAAGAPVVTTPIGAEGFPVIDGEECLIASSIQEFAEKCNQCLDDSRLWNSLQLKSKLMLVENFSPFAISTRLRNILTEK